MVNLIREDGTSVGEFILQAVICPCVYSNSLGLAKWFWNERTSKSHLIAMSQNNKQSEPVTRFNMTQPQSDPLGTAAPRSKGAPPRPKADPGREHFPASRNQGRPGVRDVAVTNSPIVTSKQKERYLRSKSALEDARVSLQRAQRTHSKQHNLFRQADRDYKSRATLAAEGVEENPGPATRRVAASTGSDTTDVRGGQARIDKQKAQDKPKLHKKVVTASAGAMKLLQEEIVNVAAQLDAREDVSQEKCKEEAYEKLTAKVGSMLSQAQASLPTAVSWHCGHEQEFFSFAYEVKPSLDMLTAYPVPHRVATAQLLGVDSLTDVGGVPGAEKFEREWMTPHANDVSRPKGPYHWARYSVQVLSLDSRGDVVNREEYEVPFPLEQLVLARERRIARYSYASSLPRVRNFRSQCSNFGQKSYDRENNSEKSDELFCALLLVDDVVLENASKLWAEVGIKKACQTVRREVMRMEGEPIVEGCYVRGYDLNFRDLFPDVLVQAADRVRSGESAAFAAAWAHEKLSVVGAGFRRLKERPSEWARAWEFCRAAPVYIRGLIPAFPNPASTKNAVVGLYKRIIRPARARDGYAVVAETLIADELATEVSHHRTDFSPESILMRSDAKAREEIGWSDDQRKSFVAGAQEAVQMVLTRTGEELTDRIKKFGVFLKAETYDPDAKKAVRYIVAPKHYVRGLMFALLVDAEEAFVHAFGDHLVKGLRVDVMRQALMEKFRGIYRIFESDYSSFESLIQSGRQLTNEEKVLVAGCAPAVAPVLERLLQILATTQLEFDCEFGKGILPNIRLSGTHHTSVSNAIQNICASFGALCRAAGNLALKAREFFRNFRLPWMVEGDDGVFALPEGVKLDALVEAHKKAGNTVTSELHAEVQDANFCGAHMVLGDKWEVFKDPLECLSKVFHSLKCDMTTKFHDAELMVAKAMSYLTTFPGLPIMDVVLAALLERHQVEMYSILNCLRNQGPRPAMKTAGMYGARYFHDLEKGGRKIIDAVLVRFGGGDMRSPVSHAMRCKLQSLYHGLSAARQVVIETELVKQIKSGAGVLISLELADCWSKLTGVSAMLVREVEGRRLAAEQAVAALQQKAAGVGMAARLSGSRILTSLSVLMNGASVVGALGLAAVGFSISSGGLGVLITLGLFFGVVLGAATGAIVLAWAVHHALGIPQVWAKRLVQGCCWGCLGLLSLVWLRWVFGRAAAPALPAAPASVSVGSDAPAASPSGQGSPNRRGTWFSRAKRGGDSSPK